ncbi:transcription factor Ouib-like isoform X3 [Scaptodrosophila lebanonensis]|uniref:Transcription factor Ouib-like isoform X3 n=1 Tax=Drosophila lebanonensis TaxID=7225 RepID=A0A6J2TBA8_DROLE|nr:transcription factor Ouib-like isoform X3 [Scaptodrosophila lebanonensis]
MDFSTEQTLNYLLTDESLNYMACQSICRLCGEFIYDGAENIFVKGGGVLRHHIESLTGLWLEDISNMPDQICIPCSFDLDQAVAFRERCISTQLRLLKNVHDNSNRTNIGFEIYELGECGKSPDPATTNGSQIHESSTDCIGVWDNPEDGIGHSNPPQIVGEATMHQRRIRKRKHVCEKCRRKFDNTEFYEKHLLRHLANGRFHCKLCDLKYDRKSDFARHLRSFHERKELLPCRHDKCNEKFTSQTYRLKHEKHLKNNRFARFYCKLGGHTFERKCHFIGHICLVHKDKTPDEITNNSGEILNPLQNGEVATTEESNVQKIEDCGGSLVKRRLYCKLCGRVFGRNSNLLRHMRYHKEKKSIPCTYDNCNMEFISVAARLEHEAKHTMLNEERREHEMSDPSPKVQKPDDICNMEVKPQSNRLDNGSSDDSGECNKPEEGSEYSNPLRTEDVATTGNRNVQKKNICVANVGNNFPAANLTKNTFSAI